MRGAVSHPGPRLRPGLHVVRRDDEHVQVGVDPPARVVLPATSEVLGVLDSLAQGRPVPPSDEGRLALDRLREAGLVEEPLPAPGAETAQVAVVARGIDLTALGRLAGASGVRFRELSAAETADPDVLERYDVAVVASRAPLARGALDAWMSSGVPHLVLEGTGAPGALRVGPFVVPGETACVRCVDAHAGAERWCWPSSRRCRPNPSPPRPPPWPPPGRPPT